MNTNGGEPTLSGAGKLQYTRIQLIPWSSIPMNKPVLNELVERKVKDGDNFQVGRQVHKEVVPGAPPTLEREFNPLDVWFMSKVVSRAHAEFCFKEGQVLKKHTIIF